jgi:hypothetical protein
MKLSRRAKKTEQVKRRGERLSTRRNEAMRDARESLGRLGGGSQGVGVDFSARHESGVGKSNYGGVESFHEVHLQTGLQLGL